MYVLHMWHSNASGFLGVYALWHAKASGFPGVGFLGRDSTPHPPPQAKKKGALSFFFWTGIHVKLRISKLRIFWRNERKF